MMDYGALFSTIDLTRNPDRSFPSNNGGLTDEQSTAILDFDGNHPVCRVPAGKNGGRAYSISQSI
jgi:hypothetical protein